MKIAIVSDMHIGYDRFYDDALKQAGEALERACELADMIIIPGDVFDKRAPKPEVIASAINIFRNISRRQWSAKLVDFRGDKRAFTNVPVIAISGTHERTAAGKDNPLNLLALAGLLVDASESTAVVEKDGERVAVYGLGGLSEERVLDKIKELKPAPVDGAFNIFMFHQSVYEILPFSDTFIHYADLPAGFDLYVDGHIHSRVEAIVHGKPFIIPGSTVLTQLKDGEQAPKGFVVFDTSTRKWDFVEIDSRAMYAETLELDDVQPSVLLKSCEEVIERSISRGKPNPIIRIKVIGSIAEGFSKTDMPVQSLIMRFAGRAVIEIDQSRLVSEETERRTDEIRGLKSGGATLKEMGLAMLADRLKSDGFPENIDASELFMVLSSQSKKEKVMEDAAAMLGI